MPHDSYYSYGPIVSLATTSSIQSPTISIITSTQIFQSTTIVTPTSSLDIAPPLQG